jgi:hypothetical protein
MPTPITSKQELIRALTDAAKLEHQFMVQYLYAAFSLKKNPDSTCDAAAFESVRRWASTAYAIARQEMEHLSVVNSILTAIGGPPCFYHDGFPTRVRWYTSSALARRLRSDAVPCELPFVLERLELSSVRRYACMESPSFDGVPPPERPAVLTWCFQDASGQCPCVNDGPLPPMARAALDATDIEIGTVEELYAAIGAGLELIAARDGEAELFNGKPSGQAEIPSEYDIYLFPITDLSSALAGVDMVTAQGEGLRTYAGFQSHFLQWVEIAREYEALLAELPGFEPSKRVAKNPSVGGFDNPFTDQAAAVWNAGYLALLHYLTGYYARYSPDGFKQYPYFSAALETTAFAPIMTMLVRSLGEVLTDLHVGCGPVRAGPAFFIPDADRALLEHPENPVYADIDFYWQRLAAVSRGLDELLASGPPPEVQARLVFIAENVRRVVANVATVYQRGIFPALNPDLDHTCPSEETP